jgi:hypothetical protein
MVPRRETHKDGGWYGEEAEDAHKAEAWGEAAEGDHEATTTN